MKKTLLYFILYSVLFGTISFSKTESVIGDRSDPASIKGKVMDENNQPVEFVNISVHKKADSSIVTGVYSKKDGIFEIPNLPSGEYFVKISCIGYSTKFISKVSIPSATGNDLGVVKIHSTAIQMNEKTITAERVAEEFKTDKKVINVSSNLAAVSGTALDVLQNQPSIQVDANGNVSLRGSSNFVVQVNGRPSPIQGSDALKQISANQIENIELITNPSAKYDAEGSAGIINIILKKQIDNSFAGIVNSGAGSRNKYNSDFTLNYRSDDLSYSGGFDYRMMGNINNQGINRESPSLTIQKSNTDINIKSQRENYNGRLSIELKTGNNSNLLVNGSVGNVAFDGGFTSMVMNYSTNDIAYNKIIDDRIYKANFFNVGTNYIVNFTPKVDELSFDLSFTKVKYPSTQTTSEYLANTDYSILNLNTSNQLKNNSDRIESRFKANYKYSFNPKKVFETGIQSNLLFSNINLISSSLNPIDNSWIQDPLFSNSYEFRNNIFSGYATYSDNIFDFDYQVGFRAEYTDRLLNQLTIVGKYGYQKLDLFPSAYLTKKITEDQQIQLNYSRRINRPPDQMLNPFPNVSTSQLEIKGNPNLKPEFVNSYELNYQKYFKGAFASVQAYYRQTVDGLAQFISQNDSKTTITFENLTESRAIGLEFSGSATLSNWLKIDPALNIFDSKIIGSRNVQDEHMYSWSARLNSTITISPVTRFMLTGFYNGKNIISMGEIGSMFNWSAAIRHELFDKKLSLNLSARNLFYTPQMKIVSYGNNFLSNLMIRPESPVIMLTASYNFNNFKRNPKTQTEVDINTNTGF